MGLAISALDSAATALEISNLELEIILIDNRRQRISYTITDLSTEFSTRLSEKTMKIDLTEDLSNEQKDDLELDWEQFKLEYDVAVAKLNAQDKLLEQERAVLETKKSMLTTHQESVDKRTQKNAENVGKES